MTNEEKRLRVLSRLFLVKICSEENKRFSRRIYFKFRKWHPIILILFVWKVSCYIIKSSYDFIKELIDELNEEDFIEIMNDNKED